MKSNLKAYITFFHKDRTVEHVVLTLEEAKERLTKKEYEKLISFSGIRSNKMNGYVA